MLRNLKRKLILLWIWRKILLKKVDLNWIYLSEQISVKAKRRKEKEENLLEISSNSCNISVENLVKSTLDDAALTATNLILPTINGLILKDTFKNILEKTYLTSSNQMPLNEIILLQDELKSCLMAQDPQYQPMAFCMESLANSNLSLNALTIAKRYVLNKGNSIGNNLNNFNTTVTSNMNTKEQAETLKIILPEVGNSIKTVMEVLNSLMGNLCNNDVLPPNYPEYLIYFYNQIVADLGG